MSVIVPRWEWRTFGEHFGGAEEHFAALPPQSVQDSDELYLLSVGANNPVKIRDELLDVKRLEHVNGDGLEQWRPVMKAALRFPLPRRGRHSKPSACPSLRWRGRLHARRAYR